jgi:hypothetical protein
MNEYERIDQALMDAYEHSCMIEDFEWEISEEEFPDDSEEWED